MAPSPPPAFDMHSPLELTTHPAPASNGHPPRPLMREGARYWGLSPMEQALVDAMDRSSSPPPEAILGKHSHESDVQDGDTKPDEGPSPATQPSATLTTVSNIKASSHCYAVKKKLHPKQRDELDIFMLDALLGREAKLFVLLTSLKNKINAQESSAASYALSKDLKTNINSYSLAMMLSVNISAYKGTVPTNHVLDILKRYHFDLPPGIEHDLASWEKVTTQVSYALTQAHAKVKKLVKLSIETNQNIFALAQLIVQGSPCHPTLQLCGRVALMAGVLVLSNHNMSLTLCQCSIYHESGGKRYWNDVDAHLQFIREAAKGSSARANKAFAGLLKIDRKIYSAMDNYKIKDIVADEWQQWVDDIVGGTVNPVVVVGGMAPPVAMVAAVPGITAVPGIAANSFVGAMAAGAA